MEKYLNSNEKPEGWAKIYEKMKSTAKKTIEASYLFLDQDRK